MKAACYHAPMDLTCEQTDRPACQPTDVMVKVGACGICGSDLHFYKLGLFSEVLGRPTEKGLVPGHEFGGEVVEVGDQVQGISVGDRVTGIAFGAMAEYVPITPAILGFTVYKLPDEVSFDEAATVEPLSTSYHATRLGEPVDGESAVVFGAGIIGLGIIQSLKALDVKLKNLIVVDVSEKRLEMARQLGATHTVNPRSEDIMVRAREITGEMGILVAPGMTTPAVDLVYDAVGYIKGIQGPPIIQQATELVRDHGRVVVVGAFEGQVSVDLMPFLVKQVRIQGSYGYWPDQVIECIELIRNKKVDRMTLITHAFGLDQAKEAFDTQADSAGSIKVILKP